MTSICKTCPGLIGCKTGDPCYVLLDKITTVAKNNTSPEPYDAMRYALLHLAKEYQNIDPVVNQSINGGSMNIMIGSGTIDVVCRRHSTGGLPSIDLSDRRFTDKACNHWYLLAASGVLDELVELESKEIKIDLTV